MVARVRLAGATMIPRLASKYRPTWYRWQVMEAYYKATDNLARCLTMAAGLCASWELGQASLPTVVDCDWVSVGETNIAERTAWYPLCGWSHPDYQLPDAYPIAT